jgi:hypothetical protein
MRCMQPSCLSEPPVILRWRLRHIKRNLYSRPVPGVVALTMAALGWVIEPGPTNRAEGRLD